MPNIELYKTRIENAEGTKAFYPHTSTDVVFDNQGNNVDTLLTMTKNLIDNKAPLSHTHTKSQITDFPTKISAFTNDSDYQNAKQVDSRLTTKQNKVLFGTGAPSNDIGIDGDIYIQIEG